VESTKPTMPQPHHSGSSSELELLRALIDSFDRSRPSQADVEKGLETALARLMLLEGKLREQRSLACGTWPTDEPWEDCDLIEEIRALREAVADVRACTTPRESAPLAQGFVLRRKGRTASRRRH
jgi:hypothetical protein